jgi:AraC family transcriptional regulator, positive regulator of tynA and feaB
MQSFSTSDIPLRSRVEFWNEVAADALARMEIQPRQAGEFAGMLCSDQVGPLVVCRAISTAASIRRQRTQIRQSTERVFLINLADQGAFTVSQRGQNATLFEGDFTINDTAEPFAFAHHSSCKAVVLRVPATLMKAHIPVPEELVGLAISALGSFARGQQSDECSLLGICKHAHEWTSLGAVQCAQDLRGYVQVFQ